MLLPKMLAKRGTVTVLFYLMGNTFLLFVIAISESDSYKLLGIILDELLPTFKFGNFKN